MRVLFCASEVYPFAKTGGLADVAGSLPVWLAKAGADVRVVMPGYGAIKKRSNVFLPGRVRVWFVENEKFFGRGGLYGTKEGDYPDNAERFSFFSKGVLMAARAKSFKPDIIHCNDWQTALVPAYLRTVHSEGGFFAQTRAVFTIHNVSYQGIFPGEKFAVTGLPDNVFNMEGLEYYGNVNFMKGGIVFSDAVTTVSPSYVEEIQTPEFGCGLDGLLRAKAGKLKGIINGIDYSAWNPEKDRSIPVAYSFSSPEKKVHSKLALQKEMGLPPDPGTPLMGMVSRLAEQKGLDLVADAAPALFRMGFQMVILGTGDEKYRGLLERLERSHRKNLRVKLAFDTRMSHMIYSGSDIFLMPSRYEPCGLGQLIALRYGAIPLVRETGGLKDTVRDISKDPEQGNGFSFSGFSSREMLDACKRAIGCYKEKKCWNNLVKRAMQCDFSWKASASEYIRLYESLL